MTNEIHSWLENLGLSQYESLFVKHDIDFETLPLLQEGHLEKLPISLGHRLKILHAIRINRCRSNNHCRSGK